MNVGFTVLFTPQTSPLLIAAGFRTVWFNVPVPPDTYSRTANYYVKRLLIPATPKLHFLSTRAYMLYAFFWVIPRCLEVICRRFGTICLLHLHRRIGMEMEQTERSETLVYKIQNAAKVWNPEEFYYTFQTTPLWSLFYKRGLVLILQ